MKSKQIKKNKKIKQNKILAFDNSKVSPLESGSGISSKFDVSSSLVNSGTTGATAKK